MVVMQHLCQNVIRNAGSELNEHVNFLRSAVREMYSLGREVGLCLLPTDA